MTPQGLNELRKLERAVRKLRNETEEIHGQIRDLLWDEEENNQQLDGDKAMTIAEIIKKLEEWKDDNESRSFLLVAEDEDGIKESVKGSCINLGAALASVMNDDEQIEKAVQWTMNLKEMDVFNDEDNDEE